jgi:hypothetical protein
MANHTTQKYGAYPRTIAEYKNMGHIHGLSYKTKIWDISTANHTRQNMRHINGQSQNTNIWGISTAYHTRQKHGALRQKNGDINCTVAKT